MTETIPIMKYLCEKHNPDMLGKTLEDRATIEQVGNVISGIKGKVTMPCYSSGDEGAVAEAAKEGLPSVVKFLGTKEYLIGDYLTWLDLYFFEVLELINFVTKSAILEEFTTIKEYHERIANHDKVKAYRTGDRWDNLIFNNKVAKINGTG